MSSPFVSFVFPAHAAGFELLRRSVVALENQTCRDFEAVIAIDAPGLRVPKKFTDLARNRDFRARVVASPREPGKETLPHRNHARNAGCRTATGEYIWALDSDIIADPNAVEHLRAVVKRATKPLVVSPCLAQPDCSPTAWLAGDVDAPRPLKQWTSSGKLSRHRPGKPSSVHLPQLIEGQPAFPRRLWETLGGYDERFLAWGGNKIELCRRFRFLDLEGLLEVHLLTSCLFLHQPHEKDPLHFDQSWRDKNNALFYGKQSDMEQGVSWWREQVERVRNMP